MIVIGLMILLSAYSSGYLIIVGQPEIGPVITGYLGILLMTVVAMYQWDYLLLLLLIIRS